MIFNPVGAGAFVDTLPNNEQRVCLIAIMTAMLTAFSKRSHHPCLLLVSGCVRDGKFCWENKCGTEAVVDIPDHLKDRLVVGGFDCLSLAQSLADSKLFNSVSVTMAADKHRVGNAWRSIRQHYRTGKYEFSARNASDENNTRRSSLVSSVLCINSPHFDWKRLTREDIDFVLQTQQHADEYIKTGKHEDYSKMMQSFSGIHVRGVLCKASKKQYEDTVPKAMDLWKIRPQAI